MKIEYVRILCVIFLICNLLLEAYCSTGSNILRFEQRTVTNVSLVGDPQEVLSFFEPEDRQKLCFYAAVKAKLPWVDFSYVPYWQKDKYDSSYYGMLCKGLPDFYLLREQNKSDIQIRIVRSPFDHYKFDVPKMFPVESITLRDDLTEKFSDTVLAKVGLDDRKKLCALALKHSKNHFYFVDGDVEKAQPYEFEYKNKTETDIAIPCPTSPKLYLRPGKSSNRIELVFFKSGIDIYSFEKDDREAEAVFPASEAENSKISYDSLTQLNADDRIKLCTLARQWNGLTTLDMDRDVSEPQKYTFHYSGKHEEEHNIAVLCPMMPLLYLRLVDKNKIKLTFSPIEADFQVIGLQVVAHLYRKIENERTPEDKQMLQHSIFTHVDDDTRWRICHIAQKYILKPENRLNFRFTKAENVLLPFKMLLTPNSRSMDKPDLRVIRTDTDNGPNDEDVAYRCTIWPEMYIRIGRYRDEIKIILLAEELSD